MNRHSYGVVYIAKDKDQPTRRSNSEGYESGYLDQRWIHEAKNKRIGEELIGD